MSPPDPRTSFAGGGLPGQAAQHGVGMTFGRSLLVSASLHAAAIGCSLLVVFGEVPGLRGAAPQAHIVFAEAPPESTWRLEPPEPQSDPVEAPEEPAAELVPVEEEPPTDPFIPDRSLAPVPLSELAWTRVGPEPLADLSELAAERARQEALAAAAAPPPSAAAPAAPATPRGESHPLRLVDGPAPAYPRISLRLEEEGVVVLRIHVGPDGHVSRVELLESSGFARLDEAAREAVRLWRFDPELRDGQAIASALDHRVVFVLDRAGHR